MRSSIIRVAVLTAAIGLVAPAAMAVEKPDAWLTTKAKIALLTTKDVSSNAINVDTMDGRVTLQGKVASAGEKAKAESTVREISGVKEVHNLLQVVPERQQKAVKASDDLMAMAGDLIIGIDLKYITQRRRVRRANEYNSCFPLRSLRLCVRSFC